MATTLAANVMFDIFLFYHQVIEHLTKKGTSLQGKREILLNTRTFKKARNKTSNHALICTSVQQCHSSIKHFPSKVYAWSVIFGQYFKFVSNKNSQTNWVSLNFLRAYWGPYCAEYILYTLVSLDCLWYSKHIAQFCRCCIFRNHRYKSNYAVWYCAILQMAAERKKDLQQVQPLLLFCLQRRKRTMTMMKIVV